MGIQYQTKQRQQQQIIKKKKQEKRDTSKFTELKNLRDYCPVKPVSMILLVTLFLLTLVFQVSETQKGQLKPHLNSDIKCKG